MIKRNLIKSIVLILGYSLFQFGHMANQYYYLCVYAFISIILGLLCCEYGRKGLTAHICILGFICSLNPLVKEILHVGDKVFMTDYVFGYGSLIMLIFLITKSVVNDAK